MLKQKANTVEDGLVVFFSVSEFGKIYDLPGEYFIDTLHKLKFDTSDSLVYVSVLNKEDAEKKDNKEFYPEIGTSCFVFRPNNLKPDLSGSIYSVKLTPLNSGMPKDHIALYAKGINEGLYSFLPRILIEGGYQYTAQNELPYDERRAWKDDNRIKLVGFDLIWNGYGRLENPAKNAMAEKIRDIFGIDKEVDEINFTQQNANSFTVEGIPARKTIGMTPVDIPDPHFTSPDITQLLIKNNLIGSAGTIVPKNRIRVDISNPEQVNPILNIFREIKGGLLTTNYFPMEEKDFRDFVTRQNFAETEIWIKEFVGYFIPKEFNLEEKMIIIDQIAAKIIRDLNLE